MNRCLTYGKTNSCPRGQCLLDCMAERGGQGFRTQEMAEIGLKVADQLGDKNRWYVMRRSMLNIK